MISTINSTTAAIVLGAESTSLAAIAIVALVVLLIGKELVSGNENARDVRLSWAINIVLVPLVIVFLTTFMVKLLGIFS